MCSTLKSVWVVLSSFVLLCHIHMPVPPLFLARNSGILHKVKNRMNNIIRCHRNSQKRYKAPEERGGNYPNASCWHNREWAFLFIYFFNNERNRSLGLKEETTKRGKQQRKFTPLREQKGKFTLGLCLSSGGPFVRKMESKSLRFQNILLHWRQFDACQVVVMKMNLWAADVQLKHRSEHVQLPEHQFMP